MTTIGIFGMGYVGSEVAELAFQRGYDLYVSDIDPDVIERLRDGTHVAAVPPDAVTATTDGARLVSVADIIVIAVPSPLDSSYSVDLSALESVATKIGEVLKSNRADPPLVAVESTIPPGTTENVVVPALTETGPVVGEDLYVAHAPERIAPGSDDWPMKDLPRVVGAMTESGRDRAVSFYDSLLDAAVHPVESPSVAEASKIIENAFRDVNIAFVNEVARSLSELGIDAVEALDAAATKPFGFMRFEPGAGVGGHCIPVDPYLLIDQAQQSGFDHQLLKLARDVNDDMPSYLVDRTIRALNEAEILPKGSEVLLLGRAFKGEIEDTRNSPSYAVESGLAEYGCVVDIYDPFVPEESTVDTPYTGADAVVLVTDHAAFEAINLDGLADAGTEVFVDGRNVYTPEDAAGLPIEYIAIGR